MNAPVEYTTDLEEEQEIKLSDYIAIIKRRKKPFFLVTGLVLALAVGLAMTLPPVYRSSSLVLMEQAKASNLLENAFSEQADQSVEYLVRSVTRDETLLRLVNEFNLFPPGAGKSPDDDQVIAARIDKAEKAINVKAVNPEIINTRTQWNQKMNRMAFEISFEYPRDPVIAQKVTEKLVRMFMAENFEKRKQETEETTAFLKEQKEKLEAKVNEVEAKLEQFKKEHVGALPDQIKILQNERERTERELLTLEQQISAVRSTAFQLQGQLAGTDPYIYEDRTLIRNEEGERVLSATGRLQTLQQKYHSLISKYSPSHPAVRKVRKEIISLGGSVEDIEASPLTSDELEIARTELAEARQKYSENHPTVVRLEKKVARLEKQSALGKRKSNPKEFNSLKRVNPAFSSLKAGIARSQAELDSLLERQKLLREKLDDYAKRMELGPSVEREYNALIRDRDDNLSEIRAIKKKLAAAERAEALEMQQKGDRFEVLEKAELPRRPVKPNRPAIVLLGALLSVGLGFAVVMVLESMDETVTSRRALISITGAQPIGTIPMITSNTEAEVVKRGQFFKVAVLAVLLAVVAAAVVWVNFNVAPIAEIMGTQDK
ncbi:MAG TPA: hypothetical protein ENK26_06030 [Gammaproteobacteria bacterium]|nr:hypothetical protein [Gammaproteobacteria bacterium]